MALSTLSATATTGASVTSMSYTVVNPQLGNDLPARLRWLRIDSSQSGAFITMLLRPNTGAKGGNKVIITTSVPQLSVPDANGVVSILDTQYVKTEYSVSKVATKHERNILFVSHGSALASYAPIYDAVVDLKPFN